MNPEPSATLETGSRTAERGRRSASAPSGAPTGRGPDQLRHRDDIRASGRSSSSSLGHAGIRFLHGGYIGVDVFFINFQFSSPGC
jgi:hypothetical protein